MYIKRGNVKIKKIISDLRDNNNNNLFLVHSKISMPLQKTYNLQTIKHV